MLQSISIVNFALIDDTQSDFGPQLNVVTGETGSGKSIVMDALSLVLGARADLSAVRDASKKGIGEVVFDLSKSSLLSVLDDLEVDFEVETIFVAKTFDKNFRRKSGKLPVSEELWFFGRDRQMRLEK